MISLKSHTMLGRQGREGGRWGGKQGGEGYRELNKPLLLSEYYNEGLEVTIRTYSRGNQHKS